MSAFVVSDNHIDTLLTFANTENMKFFGNYNNIQETSLHACVVEDLQKIHDMLIAENYKAVNFRYREQTEAPKTKFHFRKTVKPEQIVMLCQCYHYQTAEYDGYDETRAYQIVQKIEKLAVEKILNRDNTLQWTI